MTKLSEPLQSIIEARHHDPFAVLGRHCTGDVATVRAFLPAADRVWLGGSSGELAMARVPGSDLFQWHGAAELVPEHYQLIWEDRQGQRQHRYDPYSFAPQLSEFDLYLYGEGKHRRPHRMLGANASTVDGIEGVLFALWAHTFPSDGI